MFKKIIYTVFLSAFVCVILLCCQRNSGLSEYAKAIGERAFIVESFNSYAEEKGHNPSGKELKNYFAKSNDAFIVEGWIFGDEDSKFLAYKSNIKTSSGSKVEIVVLRNGDYEVKSHSKK
jgi:hypothetical protein